VDVVGALISVVFFTSLVFGLIEGRTYGWFFSDTPPSFWTWNISPIPIAFLVALIAGVGFVLWGLRRERQGKSAMLAFGLLRIASFRNGNIAALVVSLGEFGIILSLPLWLQNVLGYSALQTGFAILALAIGSFVASGFAGAFGNRVSPVTIVRVGILAEVVGVVIVALGISPTAEWFNFVPGLFVYGFGVGLATAQLTGVVLKDVPLDQSGQGSGTQSTARQIGSALGIAILGTILFSSLSTGLQSRLEDHHLPSAAASQISHLVVSSAGTAIVCLDPATAETSSDCTQAPASASGGPASGSAQIASDARAAFSDSTRWAAYSAAGFLALGFLATLRLEGSGRRDESLEGGPESQAEGNAKSKPKAKTKQA
jgi:predicted MFS family arabinose efflux permease